MVHCASSSRYAATETKTRSACVTRASLGARRARADGALPPVLQAAAWPASPRAPMLAGLPSARQAPDDSEPAVAAALAGLLRAGQAAWCSAVLTAAALAGASWASVPRSVAGFALGLLYAWACLGSGCTSSACSAAGAPLMPPAPAAAAVRPAGAALCAGGAAQCPGILPVGPLAACVGGAAPGAGSSGHGPG